MIPVEDVQINLSDVDFRALVTEALSSALIQNYGCELYVNEIVTLYDDDGEKWAITFTQTEKPK